MTKSEISTAILKIFKEQFEIEQPGLDDDLREVYEFDSIDAIELLREIEILLKTQLTRDEKKRPWTSAPSIISSTMWTVWHCSGSPAPDDLPTPLSQPLQDRLQWKDEL